MANSLITAAGINMVRFAELRRTINTSAMHIGTKAETLELLCDICEHPPGGDPRLVYTWTEVEVEQFLSNLRKDLRAADDVQAVAGAERDDCQDGDAAGGEGEIEKQIEAYWEARWRVYDAHAVALMGREGDGVVGAKDLDGADVVLGASRPLEIQRPVGVGADA